MSDDRPYYDPVTERAIGEETFDNRILEYGALADDARDAYEEARYHLDIEGATGVDAAYWQEQRDAAAEDIGVYDGAVGYMQAQSDWFAGDARDDAREHDDDDAGDDADDDDEDYGEIGDYFDDDDLMFDLWDLDYDEAFDEWEFGEEYDAEGTGK